jgi:hypothetical protein
MEILNKEEVISSLSKNSECNICYDFCKDIDIIQLSCCKSSKQICVKCVSCLSTPLCPYCRKRIDDKCIPYFKQISQSDPGYTNNLSQLNNDTPSLNPHPFSFDEFILEERIINPFLYENSRRLRRQIRRLRQEYHEHRNSLSTNRNINQNTRHERRQSRRNRRHYYQQQTRSVTNLYNDLNTLDNDTDYLDDEMLFHIEEY